MILENQHLCDHTIKVEYANGDFCAQAIRCCLPTGHAGAHAYSQDIVEQLVASVCELKEILDEANKDHYDSLFALQTPLNLFVEQGVWPSCFDPQGLVGIIEDGMNEILNGRRAIYARSSVVAVGKRK